MVDSQGQTPCPANEQASTPGIQYSEDALYDLCVTPFCPEGAFFHDKRSRVTPVMVRNDVWKFWRVLVHFGEGAGRF
jgi:hypothetical protein